MRLTCKLKSKDNLLLLEPFGNTGRLLIDKIYDVDFKEYKSKRSIEQNKLLWKLIQAISKTTHNDEIDVYIGGLEEIDIKSDIAYCKHKEELQNRYRAIKYLTTATLTNGTVLQVYKVWIGSSKFNVKEMKGLISYFQDLVSSLGVELV